MKISSRIWVGVLLLSILLIDSLTRAGITNPVTAVGQQKESNASIKGSESDCDKSLWKHIYNPKRLVIQESCVTVTGTFVDASRGRTGDGCRHEADGDGHCWLKLDVRQANNESPLHFLNQKNFDNQDGNLVIEPICIYHTTQEDAKDACKKFKQQIRLPKIGAHVRITGVWVLDKQHGHMEIHPVSAIEEN